MIKYTKTNIVWDTTDRHGIAVIGCGERAYEGQVADEAETARILRHLEGDLMAALGAGFII